MYGKIKEHLSKALSDLKEAGLYKEERHRAIAAFIKVGKELGVLK